MIRDEKRKHYNDLKEFNGQQYSGMEVGGQHKWNYRNGLWSETKVSPTKWKFEYICDKRRIRQAPIGTGAPNNSKFHWYIIADQKVSKLDANTYSTKMTGVKHKIAHKRPNWNYWSHHYNGEVYEDIIISILEEIINKLKARKKNRILLNFF